MKGPIITHRGEGTIMAGTISFDGMATGMDTKDIVDKLIAVESRPKILKEAEKVRLENQAGAWRELSTLMIDLSSSTRELWHPNTWRAVSASSSNEEVLTATAVAGAPEGSYTFSVEQLAQRGQEASQTYADTDTTVVATGTLTVNVGATATDVDIIDGTLDGIASAINDADLGVSASVISVGSEYRLLVSSDESGTDNAVSLTGTVGTALATTTIQAAQDSIIKFGKDDAGAGSSAIQITSSTNEVKDVIPGVTLNLKSASPGEELTVLIDRDTESVVEEVQAFVDNYNKVVDKVNTFTAYSEDTETPGILQTDTTLRTLMQRVTQYVSGGLSGNGDYTTLRSVGLSLKDDGTIEFDKSSLESALANDFEGVQNLFDDESGPNKLLYDHLKDVTEPISGRIDSKITYLDDDIQRISDRIADLEERLEAKRESLFSKFVAMESSIGAMNSQSSFLGAQLQGINKNWG